MVDFFVLGAVKAGTTSLHNYLDQHPSIQMSRNKWTRFFHVDAGKPDFSALVQQYGSALANESLMRYRMICNARVPQDFTDYLQQWNDSHQEVIRGEISPTYMYDLKACEKIGSRFPHAKIILILRDPIQRAISHFVMDLTNRWVPEKSFADALRKEPWRVDEFWWGLRHYLRHGLYSRYIPKIQSIFDPKKIKIMLYDDLTTAPEKFLNELTDFLEIDRMRFDITERYNQALVSKPAVSSNMAVALTRFFRKDVIRVQNMINRDLGPWVNINTILR